ncbi:molybdopterin oxidoreductase family protein [Streptomyces tubbatahanensis]|uniref:Molybdopterin oxidoreductase family protein n=1 Tax=Streptomyces tubbatahanensis TaxID=2923272 RepID=A0ABY3Y2C8_9ACTN|nr:molybdopterin oxidoreductase family protein [Streptomyces tubbatahanensis]UNT00750.1 molybdopterin oxidoreductase family protein [Streptomyces tubbatahanensis]
MSGERVADIWGPRTPFATGASWPRRVDQYLVDGVAEADVQEWVRGACLLCSNGCGLEVAVSDGRMVGVRGRAEDRVNHGRLGPKGLYGWQGQQHDRLATPLIREGGRLVETDWDTAMAAVVERSRSLLKSKGPLSHAFYTSGQLMLEEYYTLCVIGKAGIGTPHMDGNTRLCTATAASAFQESFGSDGQPGSYTDVDSCDALFLFGHNVAETQTVLWTRMLDRLDAGDPPRLVCVDPRRTKVAERATVHLPVRNGTNLAVMNALVHELIARGWVNEDYVRAHTVGFDELDRLTRETTPEWAAEICGVPARDIRAAAEIFGTSERVVSTCSMGFYQSHQATAASCQVNNLHLLRGMLGRPGAGILQMNGQPSAENNREAGCGPALPGFRNWDNPDHVRELAELWNVDPLVIPHWSAPTDANAILRFAEQGSIGFLWIAGTNPAVSQTDLARIRRILSGDQCFVVVSDGYRTETTELADVVLPAALWAEKTGTFTNVDRTVHLQEKAVEPPGQARGDQAIWTDYARRMGFADKDGHPLPAWDTSEQAFEAWKAASAGRPCDYSGLTYQKLHDVGGVQWPCTSEAPNGTERLFTDGVFNTAVETCETYGHHLATGAPIGETAYRARGVDGRAILKTTAYDHPYEEPDATYPMRLTTGRTVYHWHTRTKTKRSRRLNEAAPAMWVEISAPDAQRLGIAEGDIVRVASRRGSIEAPARISHVREGVVFAPWHYGEPETAANELTLNGWDPVSKQPELKVAAVSVTRIRPGDGPAPAPITTASAPVRPFADTGRE